MLKNIGLLMMTLGLIACESQKSSYTTEEYCEILSRQIHTSLHEYSASDMHLQQLEQTRLQQLYETNHCSTFSEPNETK